jgi:hypothetical protein
MRKTTMRTTAARRTAKALSAAIAGTTLMNSAPASQAQPTTVATNTAASSSRQPAPSYEQLRKSFKVNAGVTLAMVRADGASHAGRVIELSGTITGLMTIQNTRTVLMKVDNTIVSLPVSQNLADASSLRSGIGVRALTLVGQSASQNANHSEAMLTLLAVTTQPPVAQPFAPQTSTTQTSGGFPVTALPPATSPVTVPPVRTTSTQNNKSPRMLDGGIISPELDVVLPPMTTMQRPAQNILPEPPPANPSKVTSSRPGLDPNADDTWEAQKNAFEVLARRYNKKLTQIQSREIGNALVDAGRANNIDPRFLAAIIAVESDFNIYCLSRSGAMGLGQIMPFNLKEAGITNAWNPTQNVWGTARLLRGHLNDYRNRADGTLLAVAAYNAGPGAVRRAGYKVPPGAQVQRYVWKVYYKYKSFAPDMFR